ncbi:MAG: D-alanyl-D-alanine carboxypeptidase family protein [Ruminococcus sp.]|nr:D-alanyl-D-alanine carboxypeptidase family protein [Ruminococcus sp.]
MAKHLKKSSGKCSNRLSLNALAVVLCLSILFFAVWSLFVSQDNSMYNGDSEETAEMETQSMDAEPQENTTGYLAVLLGETGQLDSTYTWITTDSTVATVDENGVVTGLSVGRCQMIVNETDDCIQIIVQALEEIDGCTYIDDILIVNKTYGLPESYDPGLQPEVESAFAVLAEDAALEGLDIYIGSSYRSYAFQEEIYQNYCELYGWEKADTFSARPGHSEHQSGLTIDCNTINDAFGETDEAMWLAEHCANYGFIIRFSEGKEDITGYKYEPWHIRYVGVEVAQEI